MVKRFGMVCCTMMLAGVLGGCNAPVSNTHDADVKALHDNEEQWVKDYAAKDVNKLVAHYDADAVLMAPGMAPVMGKDNLRKMLTQMVADPALSLNFTPTHTDVAKSGDLAFTQGSYTMTMTDPRSKKTMNDRGSYVTTYRKKDGAWKALYDIATSEVPMTAPAPPTAPAMAKRKKRR